jgi:hypothetical protein
MKDCGLRDALNRLRSLKKNIDIYALLSNFVMLRRAARPVSKHA